MRSRTVTRGPVPRFRSILYLLRRRGWLRPRRIGCLLVLLLVLAVAALWVLGRAVDGITAPFRDHPVPVAGSPFDTVAPARPASSGSPAIDRIVGRGKIIVAIQEAPGLAQRSPSTGGYTGFDIAMLDLIAHDLGVDPTRTSFKPLASGSREAALGRGEADLALGGYQITAAHSTKVDIAGPYLVLGGTEYGIGLPPGDPVLRERVTAVLRRAIDDGTWARLYTEYLGTPVPRSPVPR
ncbi:MAG: transporter substrate-binding domain-containing protein [Pseudonocardiaceae bacterium]|nr:transporter substrate-binding domain-containing protein [Pseudonocardiaceae bacterium]